MQITIYFLSTAAVAYRFIVTVATWPLYSSSTNNSVTVCPSWTM